MCLGWGFRSAFLSLFVLFFCTSAYALSQGEFATISQEVSAHYQPIFQQQDLLLKIENQWQSERINAFATRDMQDNPIIKVEGGMIRHPEMNRDAMAAILCHELGHFLGGAPKAFRGKSSRRSWSSAEGQADYFAATKCLKKLFNDDTENTRVVNALDSQLRHSLLAQCRLDQRCARIVAAGLRVSRVFAEIKFAEMPKIHTPDLSQVSQTLMDHPSPQCRLDTFVAGSRCQDSQEFDLFDPEIGACSRKNGQDDTARPLCWYSPES